MAASGPRWEHASGKAKPSDAAAGEEKGKGDEGAASEVGVVKHDLAHAFSFGFFLWVPLQFSKF